MAALIRASIKGAKMKMPTRSLHFCQVRFISKNTRQFNHTARIGSVSVPIFESSKPERVPFVPDLPILDSQPALACLQWMMQKTILGQDMIILGSPGSARRRIALRYCEIRGLEYEFLSVSRDTSESDIKQRREIKEKSALFQDQCAVNAALHGRVLIIEGIESAERNILPILNNLLENREMALEDGSFLMSPTRYDSLLTEGYTEEQLRQKSILRVHPDFIVIALSSPTPRYHGNPLDPPLRSRFQAFFLPPMSSSEQLRLFETSLSKESIKAITPFVRFSTAINLLTEDSDFSFATPPPEFPSRGLDSLAETMRLFPDFTAISSRLRAVYPHAYLDIKNAKKNAEVISTALTRFGATSLNDQTLLSYTLEKDSDGSYWLQISGSQSRVKVSGGSQAYSEPLKQTLVTPANNDLLTHMLISHATGSDICLLGPKGSGKSTLARQFALILGYTIRTQLLHKEINLRDFLQSRVTTPTGDTTWVNSNLVNAALDGGLVILDNIERLHKDPFSQLQSLISDRHAVLPDGSRLVHPSHYEKLLSLYSESELKEKKVFRTHPGFRVIAIGNEPDEKNNFFTIQTASLFDCYSITPLSMNDIGNLLRLRGYTNPLIPQILQFYSNYNEITEHNKTPFTLRHVLRCANGATRQNLHSHITQSLLYPFLPAARQATINKILKQCNIPIDQPQTETTHEAPTPSKGDTTALHLVPKIHFISNSSQMQVLSDIQKAFDANEHILLIGNQGTGKNKIADRFLELNGLPRQYIQLHRDVSIHSLTLHVSLIDGQMIFQDTPLIKAVTEGHILVVDEADKAALEVVTIFKNLVDGEMLLPDNRIILHPKHAHLYQNTSDVIIPIHPNFRMIFLANRPGWPFLGNDFFQEAGDLFSVHVVDNPGIEDEIHLLRAYGPNLSEDLLTAIASAFQDLRKLYHEGLLSYPYSTRESVSIVKHINAFPEDQIAGVLSNVFSYDIFNTDAKSHILDVFHKHGFNIGENFMSPTVIQSTSKGPLRLEIKKEGKTADMKGPKHGKEDPDNNPHVGGNQWAGGTGGSDTAGLGGRGGPYRLDKGHNVHQLSDEEKAKVDPEVLEEARRMGKHALQKRLEELEMTQSESRLYESIRTRVWPQILQLRVILEGIYAKQDQERTWEKNQTTGELDESKLIDGLSGEKRIYKRRITGQSKFGRQEKPKRILFVMDTSASMYRFEGYDQRLTRMLEASVLIMESFEGFQSKIDYAFVGHNGDSSRISLIEFGFPPKDPSHRLKILETMVSHTQYCWPGDETINAAKEAIREVKEAEADEYFTIILSDANFKRYGISPKELERVLTSDPEVQAFAIFIASGEANSLAEALPGRAFPCASAEELPRIFNQLITTTILH